MDSGIGQLAGRIAATFEVNLNVMPGTTYKVAIDPSF